jgi:hypothetical protein
VRRDADDGLELLDSDLAAFQERLDGPNLALVQPVLDRIAIQVVYDYYGHTHFPRVQ